VEEIKGRKIHTPSDEVVTRGASTGRGNLTLDFLYLSDGWLRDSSENRVNNINILEVYHKIRGNLAVSSPSSPPSGFAVHRNTEYGSEGSGRQAAAQAMVEA
jgi:hypothetical protein